MINIFIQALIVGYSGALMPGTVLTYTFDRSLKKGWHAGFIIAFGHALLELLIIIILLFGLGDFLTLDISRIIIGFSGGTFLILMGIDMSIRLTKISDINDNEANIIYNNMMIGGVFISITNPYFIFWWAVIGLSFVTKAYETLGAAGVIIFYFGHILADISWLGFVSVMINKAKRFMNSLIHNYITAALGICLIGFGISFIIDSIKLL